MQVAPAGGGLATRVLAELLHGRFDKVIVERLGTPELITIEPDEPWVLLRLKLPAEMQAEARERLSLPEQERYIPVLFDVEFGPEAPKAALIGPGK